MRENKTCYWIAFIIFIVLSTMVIPVVSSQEAPSVSVQITSHRNGEVVNGCQHTLQGVSSGVKEHNLHLYILVNPVETNSWWVQPYPKDSWISIVYLGEDRLWGVGNNQDFIIKAIITNVTLRQGDEIPVGDEPYSFAESQIKVHRHDVPNLLTIFAIMGVILAILGIAITILKSKQK